MVSPRRWAGTTAVMAAAAWVLSSMGPGLPELRAALADPQGLVDRSGPDAFVLVLVPVLAWLCWAWGAVGLLLTAVSTVPGAAGRLAGWLLGHLLPGSARRAAALALGLGLGTVGPVALLPVDHPVVASAAAAEEVDVERGPELVDWPTAPAPDVVPDWPTAPADPPGAPPDWPHVAPGEHVVVRGECLWDIARDWLQQQARGAPVTPVEIGRATRDWWQANAAVIGSDPDRLLPGQVLRPPG